jgi:hypothetical protein
MSTLSWGILLTLAWVAYAVSTKNANSTTGEFLIELALTIPPLWLFGFILLYFIRAQIAGFRTVVPWSSLTLLKKAVVAGCAFVSFVALTFAAMEVLNLYVDTKVPVALSPFLDVIQASDEFVRAKGTWVRTDLRNDTIADPLQISQIDCQKQDMQCVEANAYVTTGHLLGVDLRTFHVKSWTKNAIVFVGEELCGTTVYTIDLNTKAVSGGGHLTNQDADFCKSGNKLLGITPKDNWTLLLSNGFDVYWGMRMKARPWSLRFIQTLFGN